MTIWKNVLHRNTKMKKCGREQYKKKDAKMRGTNKYTDENMREIEVHKSTKMR